MATVRNTITLQDRMTPVLRSIIRALNDTVDCLAEVDNISGRNFNRMRSSVAAASQAVEDLNNNVEDTQDPVNRVRSGFERWQAAIVTANQAVGLIRSGVEAVGKVTGFLDSMTSMSARVDLVNDGLQEQAELQQKIYESAQRSRASYQETSAAVAKMNLLAGNVFSSNDQAIKFVETMNKAFVLSGADSSEQASALRQMSQAMASGRLQGDEYNSIIENAPLIAQAIENYMGVSRGELKELASEGQITSDVILAAVEQASVGINQQFEDMPVTFGQAMTQIKNTAMMELGPLVSQFSDFLQSDTFQGWVAAASSAITSVIRWIQSLVNKVSILANSSGAKALVNDFVTLANILAQVVSFAVSVATVFIDNWSWIGPIVWGIVAAFLAYNTALAIYNIAQGISAAVTGASALASKVQAASLSMQTGATFAATAAQYGFNAALLACPLTWIILLIIAVIAVIAIVIGLINQATGSTYSLSGVLGGILMGTLAALANIVIMVYNIVIEVIITVWNLIATFVNFFASVWTDPLGAVVRLFTGIFDAILSIVESVAGAIGSLFGQDWSSGIAGFRKDMNEAVEQEFGTGVEVVPTFDEKSLSLDYIDYGEAWDAGYYLGEKVEDNMSGAFDMDNIDESLLEATEIANGLTNESLALEKGEGGGVTVQGSMEIDEDTIKLLKDVSSAEWVNKYTTLRPEMHVTFGDVHETADANQLLATMEDMIAEAYASSLVGEGL